LISAFDIGIPPGKMKFQRSPIVPVCAEPVGVELT